MVIFKKFFQILKQFVMSLMWILTAFSLCLIAESMAQPQAPIDPAKLRCSYCTLPRCNQDSSGWTPIAGCQNFCYIVFDRSNTSNVFSRDCHAYVPERLETGFYSVNSSVNASFAETVMDDISGPAPSLRQAILRQRFGRPALWVFVCHTSNCNDLTFETAKDLVRARLTVVEGSGSGSGSEISEKSEKSEGSCLVGIVVAVIVTAMLIAVFMILLSFYNNSCGII